MVWKSTVLLNTCWNTTIQAHNLYLSYLCHSLYIKNNESSNSTSLVWDAKIKILSSACSYFVILDLHGRPGVIETVAQVEVHLPAVQHEKPKAGKAWAVSVPGCRGWDTCQDGSKGKVKSDADPLHSSARLGLCGICADRWGDFLEVGGRSWNEGCQTVAWPKRKTP